MASMNDYLHKYSSTWNTSWSTNGTQWIDTGYRVSTSSSIDDVIRCWARSPYNGDWYRLETAWDKLINELRETKEPQLPNVEDLL